MGWLSSIGSAFEIPFQLVHLPPPPSSHCQQSDPLSLQFQSPSEFPLFPSSVHGAPLLSAWCSPSSVHGTPPQCMVLPLGAWCSPSVHGAPPRCMVLHLDAWCSPSSVHGAPWESPVMKPFPQIASLVFPRTSLSTVLTGVPLSATQRPTHWGCSVCSAPLPSVST